MCSEPATVPPRKPSLEAVASSWIEPRWWMAVLAGSRNGPTMSPVALGVSLARLMEAPPRPEAALFVGRDWRGDASTIGRQRRPRNLGRGACSVGRDVTAKRGCDRLPP